MKQRNTTHIRISKRYHERLKAIAERKGIPITLIVEGLIDNLLEEHESNIQFFKNKQNNTETIEGTW